MGERDEGTPRPVTVTMSARDFEMLYSASAPWVLAVNPHETWDTFVRVGDPAGPRWQHAYWVEPCWSTVLLARAFLESVGASYEVGFSAVTEEWTIGTDYATPETAARHAGATEAAGVTPEPLDGEGPAEPAIVLREQDVHRLEQLTEDDLGYGPADPHTQDAEPSRFAPVVSLSGWADGNADTWALLQVDPEGNAAAEAALDLLASVGAGWAEIVEGSLTHPEHPLLTVHVWPKVGERDDTREGPGHPLCLVTSVCIDCSRPFVDMIAGSNGFMLVADELSGQPVRVDTDGLTWLMAELALRRRM